MGVSPIYWIDGKEQDIVLYMQAALGIAAL